MMRMHNLSAVSINSSNSCSNNKVKFTFILCWLYKSICLGQSSIDPTFCNAFSSSGKYNKHPTRDIRYANLKDDGYRMILPSSPSFSPISLSLNLDDLSTDCQLAQLASMTTLSIDSGDLSVIEKYSQTGYITDATTNPLFVSQAGLNSNENPIYFEMVNDAIQYAIKETNIKSSSELDDSLFSEAVSLAIDKLAVNLGKSISQIVSGYVSTEVDPRLSFDTQRTIDRALRIIEMYKEMNIPKERILIKIAATWEGIQAAAVLEKEYGIQCNLTLIFSFIQAVACAQYGIHLISPFPGRILDWNKVKTGRDTVTSPEFDEGVIACKDMYNYFRIHNHDTICMPASWRPSRGSGYDLDEIIELAGSDRMTIPAQLLEKLALSKEPILRKLTQSSAIQQASKYPIVGNGLISEIQFRYALNQDGCGTDKLAEGIRAFISETEKLEAFMANKVKESMSLLELKQLAEH